MTNPRLFRLLSLSISLGGLAACGGGAAMPATAPARESGQSGLMDQSFAGKNKCTAKGHERPFVIEWDATDMSSFEARTATDVIFVKYEGCELKVLDSCVNDSVKGSLGSYKPVDWTSGSVEVIDISNEGELYAKLPLGAAELGGRVSGGEKFHMEYFVSGTRSATRDTVFTKDLEKISGCKGATHFVYAYNLGAFALGSQSKIKGTVGGSAFGFGAGGSKASENKAEKNGGLLSSCRGESAKEVSTCKVPVRLTLREISDGENPDATNATAPETKGAMNLAGKLKAATDRERNAAEHMSSATAKMNAHDGKGCIAELDAHDKLDPRPSGMSTNPKAWASQMRGQCLMLSGQCDVGKAFFRKAFEGTTGQAPEVVDSAVDLMVRTNCQGKMTPRDELLQASTAINTGGFQKTDAASCAKNYATLQRLASVVKPKDEEDYLVKSAIVPGTWLSPVPRCFAKADDCATAFKVFSQLYLAQNPTFTTDTVKASFAAMVPLCKGK